MKKKWVSHKNLSMAWFVIYYYRQTYSYEHTEIKSCNASASISIGGIYAVQPCVLRMHSYLLRMFNEQILRRFIFSLGLLIWNDCQLGFGCLIFPCCAMQLHHVSVCVLACVESENLGIGGVQRGHGRSVGRILLFDKPVLDWRINKYLNLVVNTRNRELRIYAY